MMDEKNIPPGLLYSVAPEQFAQLHLGGAALGNGFDWGESENQCAGETLASDVLEFLRGKAAE